VAFPPVAEPPEAVLLDLAEPPLATADPPVAEELLFDADVEFEALFDVLDALFDVVPVVGVDGFWHWNV
jgi:hypothetical protein